MTLNSGEKLNIAMVCDPIGSNKSGVVVSTLRFGKLLKERGHNVIFIAAKSKEHGDHSQHGDIKAYRFRSLPIPKSNGWYTAFPTTWELKKIFQAEKIDVVHVLLPMSGALIALRAARALNIKTVAHSHSQPENLFMDMPKMIQPILGKIWNRYLAWVYAQAELIIYPTEFGYKLLHHLTKKDKSFAVISNGVNIDRYKIKAIGDFYQRFNIPEDTVKIIYVGRLFPEKSIDTLIKALPQIIKEYPKIHVMLAGAGHVRPKLEKLVEGLNLKKYVTFLGLISDEDKILAYNAGDIFISPSFAELEGMTVLEAMACGKPVVIPNASMNAAKFFINGNGFLFESKNHRDLARQTLRLIVDPELRKTMGKNSLEQVKNYDINKSVDKLEAVYYSVLDEKMKEHLFEDRIYYRTNDFKPDRLTLVFVHGVSGSSSAYWPYEKIFENKYNILNYDIRGHGMSKKYPHYEDYEIKNFANDLHDLISSLNISKFILISNSFAGLVHLEYLKLWRKEIIANVFTSPEIYLHEGLLGKMMRLVFRILTAIVDFLPFNPKPRGHVDYRPFLNTSDWNIRRNLADMRNTGLHAHFYTLRQSFIPEQEYSLEKIDVPTLILHGEKDSMVPLKNVIKMSEKIKNSEFQIIPKINHNSVRDGVKEISEALESFIEKNKI